MLGPAERCLTRNPENQLDGPTFLRHDAVVEILKPPSQAPAQSPSYAGLARPHEPHQKHRSSRRARTFSYSRTRSGDHVSQNNSQSGRNNRLCRAAPSVQQTRAKPAAEHERNEATAEALADQWDDERAPTGERASYQGAGQVVP